MPRPNDIYYDKYQLPIFLTLISILWMVVGIRLWAFRKHYCGWKSWRGVSTALALSSAVLCTFYVVMLIANYFLNERIIRIRDVLSPNEATFKLDRKPSEYTDVEVNTVITTAEEIYMLQLWLRLTLSWALWLIKFAFVALFLETREALTSRWRMVLYFSALAVFVTFVVVIWTVCKDIIQSWIHPSREDIMDSIYTNGIRFVSLETENEFVLTIANIVTDILLILIACKTVTGLHRPISAASLVFIMVAITISIAVARLTLNAFQMNIQFYTTHATIPLQLLAELETFFAAIASCLPGLRVLLRSQQMEGKFAENAVVIVSDHEMLDLRDLDRMHQRPSGCKDPFTKASSSGGGSYAIGRQISLA